MKLNYPASQLARAALLTTMLSITPLSTTFAADSSVSTSSEKSAELTNLEMYARQGDWERVIDKLEDVKGKSPEQYNLLISALMNTDLDDAEEVAEEFIASYSKDYRAFHTHANVMGAQASNSIFSALGYAKKAKSSLEQAIAIAPDEIAVYRALMQFHLVAPSIAGGDMDEAKKLAEKIATIDSVEGQFALASFYLKDDNEDQARAIYDALAQNEASALRANFEFGSHYLSSEKYSHAFEALSPLMEMSVATVESKDSAQWHEYEQRESNLLYGKYRLGQVALNSDKFTNTGIAALEQYIDGFNTTNIDTAGLPSVNWAQLRLAELRLNANDIEKAKSTLALINGSEGERFSKILKALKKKIKKRA
ncbi:hypothetical protein CW735_01215 [Alteromonas sp. MB-3u-76]|jgi:tetratricopeptide (TPR) repeat protein|uniref:tetratricopeptide repeat protein n=1 Tax=unclassified Alteromonas TaxID=2614992 RepID=UPI0009030B31|nr:MULTISPECIES: hypothetical protein [unclassified Alteromonas]APE04547.1 hypothetical protein BM528_01110 [Alteromonas sp. RW2A1]AUC86979.1 hypothetical protein CW735_01215 [Alteromonas sp. MB-3u-76]